MNRTNVERVKIVFRDVLTSTLQGSNYILYLEASSNPSVFWSTYDKQYDAFEKPCGDPVRKAHFSLSSTDLFYGQEHLTYGKERDLRVYSCTMRNSSKIHHHSSYSELAEEAEAVTVALGADALMTTFDSFDSMQVDTDKLLARKCAHISRCLRPLP